MVPIPPPPDYEPAQPPPPPPPGPDQAMVYPRPGELTVGWRWVLTLGWVSVVIGLIGIISAAQILHKPPFWMGHGSLVVLPFLGPGLAALAALANHRSAVWLGGISVVALAALGVADRTATPGIAAALGVLAVVGALTTVAALAGRMPGPHRGDTVELTLPTISNEQTAPITTG